MLKDWIPVFINVTTFYESITFADFLVARLEYSAGEAQTVVYQFNLGVYNNELHG
jgi:hypothetical protein